MINIREIIGWVLALFWFVFATWLLLQPLPSEADDTTVHEDQVATKERGSTHGWVYNKKTKILQFCIQTSGEQYDANAEVMCIPYPKQLKVIDEFESFFLDGNKGYLPNE
jgi:hypothetical protein